MRITVTERQMHKISKFDGSDCLPYYDHSIYFLSNCIENWINEGKLDLKTYDQIYLKWDIPFNPFPTFVWYEGSLTSEIHHLAFPQLLLEYFRKSLRFFCLSPTLEKSIQRNAVYDYLPSEFDELRKNKFHYSTFIDKPEILSNTFLELVNQLKFSNIPGDIENLILDFSKNVYLTIGCPNHTYRSNNNFKFDCGIIYLFDYPKNEEMRFQIREDMKQYVLYGVPMSDFYPS